MKERNWLPALAVLAGVVGAPQVNAQCYCGDEGLFGAQSNDGYSPPCECPVDPETSTATEINGGVVLTSNVRNFLGAQSQGLGARLMGGGGGGALSDGFGPEGGSGLAAGEMFGLPVGAWVSYSRSDFEDDFARTAFDATRDLVLAGVDVSPLENMLVGISVGWEDTSGDTTYNAGDYDTEGVTVSPYFAVLFGEIFSLDASFGYSALETDQSRSLLVPAAVTSSVDSDRWFVGSNLNVGKQFGNFYLSGRTGLVYAREYYDGYTESDGTVVAERSAKLGQWRLGGDVSYLIGAFEPYATVTYEHDFSRDDLLLTPGAQPSNDGTGVVAGLGVRYFGPAGFTGSFEWTTVQGREDYSEDAYLLVLRGDF